jgi:hypothetical protein
VSQLRSHYTIPALVWQNDVREVKRFTHEKRGAEEKTASGQFSTGRFSMSQAEYQSIAAELVRMAEADQAMRRQAAQDSDAWDASLDAAHQRRFEEIVAEIGWPTIPLVGAEASQAAWLIAQHAPDLEFMERCLGLMQALPAKSIHSANIAYLQDRVMTRRGKPQIYGTQFVDLGEGLRVYPIQDPEHVDERRASVGLGPFAENEAQIRGRVAGE